MALDEVTERCVTASDTGSETAGLDIHSGVARVTLNRPNVRNAFNSDMIARLTAIFAKLAVRDDVAVIVLQGAGKMFCAGADVTWMRASLEYSYEENLADAGRMATMFATINATPQPLIVRVHGAALGGGMGLIAAGDIAIAAENAMFGFTETKLGIVPAVISEVVLPKIGSSWARALYVTGEKFSAETARHIGLVHWLATATEIDTAVDAKVAELRSAGPRATRIAKSLARDVGRLDPEGVRSYTAETIATVRTSEEGQEGLKAFLEKRMPAWRE